MTILRSITALGLCLFLALTSVGLAVARGAAQPVGQMVLCTGEGTRTVLVDANGQPTTPPHICPECLLAFYADAPRLRLPLPRDVAATACKPVADSHHKKSLACPTPLARAPPLSA
ncbi:hypothetical protein RA2_03667 [Roseovarius sp. A-2]|uniref:hypothetical protein n=1 Tax=Roseovarius sp. A-2 TaxID=1570360 RepID=UPI0009CF0BE6|nr:hypothetical protein [Roseovarius sp. A-2]GAW36594.1 hypothetical protein RA2_03667 [Roseovarius sp. A-2]